jgi:flagellar M-ring protein FliF
MENALATTIPAPNPVVAEPQAFKSRLATLPLKPLLTLATGVAALVAIAIALLMHANRPDFRVLYAGVSERDSGAILAQLIAMNVPYKLAEGTGAIMVASNRVHEVRMKLSSAGLPRSAIDGYELLDKQKFGQTQLSENVSIKRALEGELMRTIGSLSAVESAKVMLAIPQQNGFFREQQKPSASVVVHLHTGRTLDRAQLAGIVHLVSASVPELHPRAVKVTDGSGSLLTSPDPESGSPGLDAQQLQYVQQVETALQRRVFELIEPVVGRENLRATITADLDFSETMSVVEEFKPNQGEQARATVRQQQTLEASQGSAAPPTGVPGAQSNQAPTPATAPAAGATQPLQAAQAGANSNGRRETTTNYEVDRTQRTTRNASGTIKRLSAAVVVNHKTVTDAKGKTSVVPLAPEDMEKITALVQQAVGYKQDRGDSVRVVNTPFRPEVTPKIEDVPFWKDPWVVDTVRSIAVPAAVTFVCMLIVITLIRPALKLLLAPPPTPPGSTVTEVIDNPIEQAQAGNDPLGMMGIKESDKVASARAFARHNPLAVAHILRQMMTPPTKEGT